jgi:hypothetical protein
MSTLLLPVWIPRCFLLDAPSLPFTARAGDESRVSCPAAGVNSNQGVLCQDLSDKAQYLEIIVSSSGKLAELHSYLVKPWKIIQFDDHVQYQKLRFQEKLTDGIG